ncbi:TPA: hypothetical protein N0F65_007836 [Lagenidium giganteum]|uniref:Uncharacterized protein n=1 Tax=Lagenidium giganteum TaxID=4803 RepID=A0AAV2Z1P5_9STRA|nr:TPA: hypothetical protein N0F65_007836 [Lagenidium giganteum]
MWVVNLDEELVETTARDAAQHWRYQRNPEVVVAFREHHGAPAGQEREETRAKVTSWVDGVASVHAERHADGRDQQAERNWCSELATRLVALVLDGEHTNEQHGRAEELGVEGRRVGHQVTWVRGKMHLLGSVVWIGVVDEWAVHHEDHEGSTERTQHLCHDVAWHLAPRDALVDGEGDGDGRVQVRAADATSNVHAQHDGDAPAQVDAHERATRIFRQRHLVVDAHAEREQHKHAKELGQALAQMWALDSVWADLGHRNVSVPSILHVALFKLGVVLNRNVREVCGFHSRVLTLQCHGVVVVVAKTGQMRRVGHWRPSLLGALEEAKAN